MTGFQDVAGLIQERRLREAHKVLCGYVQAEARVYGLAESMESLNRRLSEVDRIVSHAQELVAAGKIRDAVCVYRRVSEELTDDPAIQEACKTLEDRLRLAEESRASAREYMAKACWVDAHNELLRAVDANPRSLRTSQLLQEVRAELRVARGNRFVMRVVVMVAVVMAMAVSGLAVAWLNGWG